MKYKSLLLVVLIGSFLFYISCDKVTGPYRENIEVEEVDEQDTIRKSFIIDFTGINCNNCPDGHIALDSIMAVMPGRVIAMGVHVPFLNTIHLDEYVLDGVTYHDTTFRLSNKLGDDFFAGDYSWSAGIPKGIVNTMANELLPPGQWLNKTYAYLDKEPSCLVKIEPEILASDTIVEIKVTADFLIDTLADLNIAAYVIEDSVLCPQNYYNEIDTHYVHRHVGRKSITNALGEELVNGAASGKIYKTYTTSISPGWDKHHLMVVVIIIDRNTKAIIQAQEKHLIPN